MDIRGRRISKNSFRQNTLCVFPFLFLGGFYVIDPEGTGLIFTTTLGQIVLAGVILCVFAAGRMAQKILSIEL